MIQNVIHKLRITTMNTIIAKPKPKTQEWLKKAIQATGLTPAILITALLEQEAEKVLNRKKPAA